MTKMGFVNKSEATMRTGNAYGYTLDVAYGAMKMPPRYSMGVNPCLV